jgi:hypothetical protein
MDQQNFNFDRGRKLRALEGAVLPKLVRLPNGKGISAKAMSAVLTALDSFARQADTCRVTLGDLAGRARLSEDHCGRTVQALELIFLVSVTRRFARSGQLESDYQIIWGNLEDLVQVALGRQQTDLGLLQTDLRSDPQTDPRSERYSKDLSYSKISKKITTTTKTSARSLQTGGGSDGGGGFETRSGDDDGWGLGWLSVQEFTSRESRDRLFERLVEAGRGGLTLEDHLAFEAILFCLTREKEAGMIRNVRAIFRWLFSGGRDRWEGRAIREDRERARAQFEGTP